jgi:hypothetical protein
LSFDPELAVETTDYTDYTDFERFVDGDGSIQSLAAARFHLPWNQ